MGLPPQGAQDKANYATEFRLSSRWAPPGVAPSTTKIRRSDQTPRTWASIWITLDGPSRLSRVRLEHSLRRAGWSEGFDSQQAQTSSTIPFRTAFCSTTGLNHHTYVNSARKNGAGAAVSRCAWPGSWIFVSTFRSDGTVEKTCTVPRGSGAWSWSGSMYLGGTQCGSRRWRRGKKKQAIATGLTLEGHEGSQRGQNRGEDGVTGAMGHHGAAIQGCGCT